jgi:hypothetical protein
MPGQVYTILHDAAVDQGGYITTRHARSRDVPTATRMQIADARGADRGRVGLEQHRDVDRLTRTARYSGAHPPSRGQRRHVTKEPLVIGGGAMAIDEPDRLIVTVSQSVPVTGSRCNALARTIRTPGPVEPDVKSALDDLKTVFNIVVHVHRGAGAVRTEPGICLKKFTVDVHRCARSPNTNPCLGESRCAASW